MTTRYVADLEGRCTTAASPVRLIPVLGLAGFAAAATLGAVLAPAGYSSVRDTVSVLAAADNRFGAVMVAGFLALSVGLLTCAERLWSLVGAFSGRLAAVMVGVAGGATAVAGLSRV